MTDTTQEPVATLACYAAGPAQLEAALSGLTDAGLDHCPTEGGWTIRQIVHHVADGDDLWGAFVKMALGSRTGFSLQWYWAKPQDEWARVWRYADRAIEPSLALFRANRAHFVQLLGAVGDAWTRHMMVQWSDGQEETVTVGDVIAMQSRHVLGHIADIRKIRETHHV
jgi:uncharacterized damage-inducible protein DinB